MNISLIRLFSLLFCINFTLGCNQGHIDSEQGPKGNSIVVRDGATVLSIDIKPLDDPGNPYIGQYAEWDVWSYENLKNAPSGQRGASHTGNNGHEEVIAEPSQGTHAPKPDYQSYRKGANVRITRHGHLIPAVEYQRQLEQAKTEGKETEFQAGILWTFAAGDPPLEVLREMERQLDEVAAEFYPMVPDWLAANPPRGAMLYPNGDVITFGELGSGAEGEQLHHVISDTLYRYSAEGVQVASTTISPFYLYYDIHTMPELGGFLTNRNDGVYVLYDKQGGIPIEYWSYEGKSLGGVEPAHADPHFFAVLRHDNLLRLHKAQTN